jgi:hypothetical protein
MERLTLKEVMVRVNLSYNGTTSLVRRMRHKGLVREVDAINVKYGEIKVYGFAMSPEEYLFQERKKRKEPELPIGFFNNPFNLKGAVDARYQSN